MSPMSQGRRRGDVSEPGTARAKIPHPARLTVQPRPTNATAAPVLMVSFATRVLKMSAGINSCTPGNLDTWLSLTSSSVQCLCGEAVSGPGPEKKQLRGTAQPGMARCLPRRVPSLAGCKSLHVCRGWWRLAAESGFELRSTCCRWTGKRPQENRSHRGAKGWATDGFFFSEGGRRLGGTWGY